MGREGTLACMKSHSKHPHCADLNRSNPQAVWPPSVKNGSSFSPQILQSKVLNSVSPFHPLIFLFHIPLCSYAIAYFLHRIWIRLLHSMFGFKPCYFSEPLSALDLWYCGTLYSWMFWVNSTT